MKFKKNQEKIEGRIYQHDLSVKIVQNKASSNYGKEFIAGTLEVAVDNDGLNIIPIHFTYVTELTSKGAVNRTYGVLKKIIEEGNTWIADGPDKATKVSVSASIALNDFYTQDDRLVSVKMNEGSFVTIVNTLSDENERNKFETDMVITNVQYIDADEEKNIKDPYVIIKGGIFNFRGNLLPVDFIVKDPKGMEYFQNLGASNAEPIYTKVWGRIVCETKTTVVEEESAFGEAAVKTYEKKTKEWIVVGSSPVLYEFGEEDVLTAQELTDAMQARELMLADIKKRNEEYKMQKAAGNTVSKSVSASAPTPSSVTTGTFNF